MKELARFIKPVLYVSAMCGTVVLSSLPLVLYYTARYTDFGGDPSIVQQQTSALSTLAGSVDNQTSCTSVVQWGTSDTDIDVCELYSGDVCLQYLMEWQKCIPLSGNPGTLNIAIDSTRDMKSQLEREQDILQVQQLLELYGFNDCRDLAIPMLCHYYFPLMSTVDCSSSSQQQPEASAAVYTLTQEDCYNIDNTVCSTPWGIANSIESFRNSLPDCSTLPNKNDIQTMNDSIDSLIEDNATLSSNITCRDDFILVNQVCFPRCDRFEDHSYAAARLTCQLVGAGIAVAFSILAFILSVINRKIMFRFPSFFLVLLIIGVFIEGMVILVQAFDTGERAIMCSSVNLLEALARPTPYCIFSGAVFHYIFGTLMMWWFFHTCVFFYSVQFPFHAGRMKKLGTIKKLAAVLVITGLIVPFLGVIISFSLSKYGYGIFSFPPEGCTPITRHIWLGSVVYPFTIISSIGGCLLVSIFWKIHKNQIHSGGGQKTTKLTKAEKRLIVALLCYTVFGIYSNVVFALITGNSHRVFDRYFEYFLCELDGHVPGKCDRSGFERHQYPIAIAIGYISLPMIPVGAIFFIVNWDKLWKSTKDWFKSSLQSVPRFSSHNSEQ